MRGLIYGFVVALAFAAPAFAGDLTSIELDPSGKAIAVKKDPGKLAPIPDIGGEPNKKHGEIAYRPDDVILFQPHTWHGWVNGDTPFEFLGFDMQAQRK
jgi:hypothetical protein